MELCLKKLFNRGIMESNRAKISKGYRLKPDTHEKINRIKNILNADSDNAINKACEKLLNEIERNSNNKTIKGELK